MIKKIISTYREQRYLDLNVKVPLDNIFELLNRVKINTSVLVICPQTTGYNWMGVNRATKSLFNHDVLELPQYFSKQIYSDKELKQLINEAKKIGFEQIILSGFPPYFEKIVKYAHEIHLSVSVIYHGFFSEFSYNQPALTQFNTIIGLCKEHKIRKTAFNKKNFSVIANKLFVSNACEILLKTPVDIIAGEKFSGMNIGVLVNNDFRKNLHNQVVAAAMVKNSIIHLSGNNSIEFQYLNETRMVNHKANLHHETFMKLLSSMTVNLHVTFSESWGQLMTESLAAGVPCLCSDTNSILDYNVELKNMLLVNSPDDSLEINKKLLSVLETNTAELSAKCIKYIHDLNAIADDKLADFLN